MKMPIRKMIKLRYILGSLLILFFFLRGGEILFNQFSPNWAYIIDQLGLAFIGGVMGLIWLKRKNYFRLGWPTILIIILLVNIAHYHSFFRPFWWDELRNIINFFGQLHGTHGTSGIVATGFSAPITLKDRYGWAYAGLIYELIGVSRPYFVQLWAGSSIFLLTLASISTAWLVGAISKSRVAALIAGLLIGIAPNSFVSLLRISNIQTDGLGAILVTFTILLWFVARKTQDKKGLLLAIILFAAALKGGSVVRTAMTGFLLILTDLMFFPDLIKKGAWRDWFKIFFVYGIYYISNSSSHWQPASTPSSTTMSFPTRLAFLADATTRSFIPPLMLIPLVDHLRGLSVEISWIVTVGIVIFIIGSLISLLCLLKPKLRYISWGWVWFYLNIWFFPWLAELHDKPSNTVDMTNAGFNYGYLSLIGMYIATGIFLSSQIKKLYSFSNKKQRILGVLFTFFTIVVFVYRINEFVILDRNWRNEYSDRVGAWFSLVFQMIPPPTGTPQQNKEKFALVELDKDHVGMEAELFVPTMYYDGSLLFYRDSDLFYKEAIINKKIPPSNVYAVTWDVNEQKVFNLTTEFREFLIEFQKNAETPNFSKWQR